MVSRVEGLVDDLADTNLDDADDIGEAPGLSADPQASTASDADPGDSPEQRIAQLEAELEKRDRRLTHAQGRVKSLTKKLDDHDRTGTVTNRKLDTVIKAQAGTLDPSQVEQRAGPH